MSRPQDRGSLFAAISEGVLSHEYSARLQKLEIGLGFLGFFTFFSVVATVAAEVSGKDALAEALISAVLVAATYSVYRTWRKVGRLAAEDAAKRQALYDRENGR